MNRETKLCWFCIFLLLFSRPVYFHQNCAHFQFPTLSGSELTVPENSTVVLPFDIINETCEALDHFSLKVTKITSFGATQCSVIHINGKCQPPVGSSKCTCVSDIGGYLFTHKVDRSDGAPTQWAWSTSNHAVGERNITFNVLYPGRITSLSIVPHEHTFPVTPSTSVDVVCLWENGNPSVTARLMDRHGTEINGSIRINRKIQHRFLQVGCQDAGLIRCEAPGASHNETATLLVKCPPEITDCVSAEIPGVAGSVFDLECHVRSFTPHFRECSLKKQSQELQYLNCSSLTTTTGSPPDLVLIVRLDNVRKQDEGQWQLDLANEAGTGQFSFAFRIAQSDQTTREGIRTAKTETSRPVPAGTNAKEASFTLIYIAVIIAVVLIVGIISVSITVICVKKGGGASTLPAAREVFSLEERAQRHRHSTGSNQSTHTYEEVRHGPFARLLTLAAAVRPSPRRCQAPREDPDDYLHPVATSAGLQESQASTDSATVNEGATESGQLSVDD